MYQSTMHFGQSTYRNANLRLLYFGRSTYMYITQQRAQKTPNSRKLEVVAMARMSVVKPERSVENELRGVSLWKRASSVNTALAKAWKLRARSSFPVCVCRHPLTDV
ncbi:hypothetical protein ABW21_db0209200 [Orbilia brochopaga]|nr:hypothetical protein ABW21_db0209200 [Drechslerella brochopaga]